AAGATFTVLGNFGITLTAATNNVTGPVGFNNPAGDARAAVSFTNNGTTTLDGCDLGLGAFTVTASGNIASNGAAITQKPGAGAVTFNASGTSIDLSNAGASDFTGPIAFHGFGGNLTTLG